MAQKSEEKSVPGKLNLLHMRERDREQVRGKFIFHEVPGGTLKFCFKAYKQDQVEKYELTDGFIYTVPRGVAKHLNKNCSYPIHAHAIDENGKSIYKVGQTVRRCSFQSLEFMEQDDYSMSPERTLTTVERM